MGEPPGWPPRRFEPIHDGFSSPTPTASVQLRRRRTCPCSSNRQACCIPQRANQDRNLLPPTNRKTEPASGRSNQKARYISAEKGPFIGSPSECKLFNMETAVNKLAGMFQKAESDLDYIEHKLEFEIKKNLPQNVTSQENPVKLLEQLRIIKSRYRELCAEADQIAIERKETVDFIRTQLATTLQLVQKLQDQSDLESYPLKEDEQWAMQKIMKSDIVIQADPCERGQHGECCYSASDLGSNLVLIPRSLDIIAVSAWIFSRCSGFLQPFKNVRVVG
ncbi:SKA complex subunit 2 isoform X2 [Narcine bancroftii]|uniref:SKA complex subunit 2 isoform X2 n=1 Tax=Narcine bancroftii TaxID=1343680 RepID=UPI003831FE69